MCVLKHEHFVFFMSLPDAFDFVFVFGRGWSWYLIRVIYSITWASCVRACVCVRARQAMQQRGRSDSYRRGSGVWGRVSKGLVRHVLRDSSRVVPLRRFSFASVRRSFKKYFGCLVLKGSAGKRPSGRTGKAVHNSPGLRGAFCSNGMFSSELRIKLLVGVLCD